MNIIYLSLIYLILASYVWSMDKNKKGDIIIIFKDLKNDSGQIVLDLYMPFEGKFPNEKAIYKRVKSPINNRTAIVKIKDVSYGNYAFASFHDENNSGDIDTGFLGIPTEGWAFSNNSRGLFGPPTFEKAKFTLKSKKKEMSIKMNY